MNDKELVILSVGHARDTLGKLSENKERLAIVSQVITQERIRGSADDYHNLAVTYTRDWDDYQSGFSIIEKGLHYYPQNVDLLADAVYYGSSAGEFQKCETYKKQLESVPMSLWNWRAFTFLIDYILQKTDWEKELSTENIQNMLNEALVYAQVEQVALSGDAEVERGYLAEHKIRVVLERILRVASKLERIKAINPMTDETEKKECEDKAHEYDKRAIEEREKAVGILRKAIMDGTFAATACCLKLADILFERQDFSATIEICNIALRSPQSQPSANLGYFMYLIAMSEDALIHKDNLFGDQKRVENVYRTYLGAYRCSKGRNSYRGNIYNRISILEAKTGVQATDFHQEVEREEKELLKQILNR